MTTKPRPDREQSHDGPSCPVPALGFNPQDYRKFLEGSDWSEAQKDEFLHAVWGIIVGFVDLGFALHPIQHVMNETKTLDADSATVLAFGNIADIIETTGAEHSEGSLAGGMDS